MNKPKILKKRNYISMIKNSVGSTQYQNLWVEHEDGTQEDVTRGGELSCGVYITSLLLLFGLIEKQKATVDGTIEYMEKYGWEEIEKEDIQEGDAIVWNKKKDKDGETHGHIGFYVGDNKAVSNSTKLKKIVRHGWDYGGRRKIEKVLRWNKW